MHSKEDIDLTFKYFRKLSLIQDCYTLRVPIVAEKFTRQEIEYMALIKNASLETKSKMNDLKRKR